MKKSWLAIAEVIALKMPDIERMDRKSQERMLIKFRFDRIDAKRTASIINNGIKVGRFDIPLATKLNKRR